MKQYKPKVLTAIAILLFSIGMRAQTATTDASLKEVGNTNSKKQSENILRTVNDLKTGNWQDVLSSFLQLSFSDLTGEKKAVSFKANLFALKVKADSNLLLSDNYVKQKFSRNFQFDFFLNLDTLYKFKGFRAGFSWAIVNKRDSSVVSYANTELDRYFSNAQRELSIAANAYRESLLDDKRKLSAENAAKVIEVRAKTNKILEDNFFVAKDEYPSEIQNFLDDTYITNFEKADSLFKDKLERLRLKPLLTLSLNSTFQNKEKAFSNGSAQIVYLQGFKTFQTKTEFDIRSSLTIKDTLVVSTDRRTEFNSSAGINFTLLESKKGKTIIVFKPYFEYKSILTKLYSAEKKEKFMANADLRFRILENFWLPLTIKYDLEKGKFLGFLDIELNFSAFKKQK